MQGQNPEETGDVRHRVLRGFPKGDNAADDVLFRVAPELFTYLRTAEEGVRSRWRAIES